MKIKNQRQHLLHVLDTLINAGRKHKLVFSAPCPMPPYGPICQPWPRISFVTRGKVSTQIGCDGRMITIIERPGMALFLPPNAWVHRLHPFRAATMSVVFRHGYIRFVFTVIDPGVPGLRPFRALYHTSGPIAMPGRAVLSALEHMAAHGGDHATGPILLEALLRMSRRQLAEDVPHKADKAQRTFQYICDYIQDHAHQAINRKEVAHALRLHPNSVSRLFKTIGRETFHQYLRKLRMKNALRLLKDRNLNIKEVAAGAGYGDQANFFRTFYAVHGMSPGAFRNRLRRHAPAPSVSRKNQPHKGKRTGRMHA